MSSNFSVFTSTRKDYPKLKLDEPRKCKLYQCINKIYFEFFLNFSIEN